MKKAYNVYKVCGKTSIKSLVKTFSFALVFGVCFLGFQTQSSAQSGGFSTSPFSSAVTPSQAKDLNNDYQFDVSMEELGQAMRNYANANISLQGDDPVSEIEYEVSRAFFRGTMLKLEAGIAAKDAVLGSYEETLNSPMVRNNQSSGIDFEKFLRGIMDALD